ncbi:MAG: tryptophan synthase subunit alpha, tryptophan synthase alpha chain [Candidatus Peregrinibacteria bacterium GW2011_GWE2_39_6]|nr:MAG: tryptophan synthase subunit alpha, tryptophan synthase alpha chain [Candidatus Peregrinibacteria bacterium GW2011_GWF2_39_17]KKR24493.1 MAG: tryptophan synthase subunit alpha, tryptophan synthase alpha chain [Candidatus Peregrinibacteria bacterium GW2011_GWE2_39_6]HCW32805.1 tryptophan synthase subunit alpha [Candidatus Peregrinibacteria bacterium]
MSKFTPIMPCTIIGDPDFETSFEIVKTFIQEGVQGIELIFPFSEPVADGPIMAKAHQRALKAGSNVHKGLAFIRKIRSISKIPLFLVTYYNPILAYGPEQFYKHAAQAGLNFVLIPDIPPEESSHLNQLAKKFRLKQIFIVSPLTTIKRLKFILKMASGFLYVVSRPGVTGIRGNIEPETLKLLAKLKKQTTLPLYVGFGISNAQQVQQVLKAGANCAIVGSGMVKIIEDHLEDKREIPKETLKMLKSLIKSHPSLPLGGHRPNSG